MAHRRRLNDEYEVDSIDEALMHMSFFHSNVRRFIERDSGIGTGHRATRATIVDTGEDGEDGDDGDNGDD
jgi:hypothetical protein